jgi:hypothetical protein
MAPFFQILSLMAGASLLGGEPKGYVPPPKMSPENVKLFETLWTGLRIHRQELRQGVFRAKGRVVDVDPDWGGFVGPVEIYCVFDFPAQNLRFDRIEAARIWAPSEGPHKKGDEDAWKPGEQGGKFIRTSTQQIYLRLGEQNATITLASKKPMSWAKPFDIRTLGLATWNGLITGQTNAEKSFQLHKQTLPYDIAEEREGIYRVRWEFPQARAHRCTIWINAKTGFSPIRQELQRRAGPSREKDWAPEPDERFELTWKQIDGVWVPETFAATTHIGPGILREYHLAFSWESVNKPVADETFTVKGLELRPGARVVDVRGNRPIVVERVPIPGK